MVVVVVTEDVFLLDDFFVIDEIIVDVVVVKICITSFGLLADRARPFHVALLHDLLVELASDIVKFGLLWPLKTDWGGCVQTLEVV